MVFNKITKPYHDIQRLGQILKVFSKYGFGYVVSKLPLEASLLHRIADASLFKNLPAPEMPLPVRFRKVAEELGPAFVKLAQALSTRPDLIPIEWCAEFEKLQDQAPPFEEAAARRMIEQELGMPPEKIFSEFSNAPFAAASLSQVHDARLQSGEKVAVKIQRPDIRKTIETDLEILSHLSNLANKYVEESRPYDLPGIVQEFRKIILKELDFTLEADNIERFGRHFKDSADVYGLKVFRPFSSERVLTLEKLDGIKIKDVERLKEQGYDLKQIAKRGAQAVLKQIFEDGFFHADPHPGNLLVLPGNVVAFIDFGMVGRLDEKMMFQLAELLAELVQKDVHGMLGALLSMGVIEEWTDEGKLRLSLMNLIDRFYEVPIKQMAMGKLLVEFVQMVSENQLKMPPVFILLLKALITTHSIGNALDPELNLIEEARPFVEKLIKKRLSPAHLFRESKILFTEMLHFVRLFPKDLRQVFKKMRDGKLKIEFEHCGLEPTLQTLTDISNRIAVAIVLAALLIGSSLIVLSKIPPLWHGIPVIGLLGFLGAGLMGLLLLLSIFVRFRK